MLMGYSFLIDECRVMIDDLGSSRGIEPDVISTIKNQKSPIENPTSLPPGVDRSVP
jgi:hypothetical protein